MLEDEMTGAASGEVASVGATGVDAGSADAARASGASGETASGEAASAVSASGEVDDENSLVPRLRVIEEQQLDQRAAAFAQIHDRLQQTLEGSDVNGARG